MGPRSGEIHQELSADTAESGEDATGPPTQPSATAGQGAEDFAKVIKGYAALPGVRLAAIASVVGIGVVLAFSLLVTILLPDSSFLSYDDDGSFSLFREVMLQAAGTSLGGIQASGEGTALSIHPTPLIFLLVPMAGVAFGTFTQGRMQETMSPRSLTIASAASGIPFALLMWIVALLASGDVENSGFSLNVVAGATFLLSLCAGAIGGAVGAVIAVKQRQDVSDIWPQAVNGQSRLVVAVLKPLGILLVAAAIVGTGIWTIQTIRDAADSRGERGVGTAIVDNFAFSGDFGVRNVGLGTMSSFKLSEISEGVHTPLPVATGGEKLTELAEDNTYNLLDFKGIMHAWVFVPLLLVLIGMPVLLALYSGFLIGREKGTDQRYAAAWGALVGPTWALTIVVLNALSEDIAFGKLMGDSVFAVVLVGGAVIGAVGGILGSQPSQAGTSEVSGQ